MANNTNQTPEQAFHYRDAICCATCPAYQLYASNPAMNEEGIDYEIRKTLLVIAATGDCKRLKMPVNEKKVCDKHPLLKTLHQGHKEGK